MKVFGRLSLKLSGNTKCAAILKICSEYPKKYNNNDIFKALCSTLKLDRSADVFILYRTGDLAIREFWRGNGEAYE